MSFDNTLLKSIGKTGLQVGLVSAVWGSVFESDRGDRHYKDLVTKKIATEKGGNITSQQDDYYLAFYPFVEYVINDTFNLRTVFRQTTFYHVRSEKGTDLVRQPGSQSIGLGISVTRDIFLYPNFQFSTENLSTEWVSKKFAKESTVGMSATINMF